jgi:hypothetical protein
VLAAAVALRTTFNRTVTTEEIEIHPLTPDRQGDFLLVLRRRGIDDLAEAGHLGCQAVYCATSPSASLLVCEVLLEEP